MYWNRRPQLALGVIAMMDGAGVSAAAGAPSAAASEGSF